MMMMYCCSMEWDGMADCRCAEDSREGRNAKKRDAFAHFSAVGPNKLDLPDRRPCIQKFF